MRLIWIAASTLALLLAVVAFMFVDNAPGSAVDEHPDDAAGQRLTPISATVVVEPGASAAQIGTALIDAGLIDSPRRFETLVSLLGYDTSLAAGTYEFEDGLTTTEIIERLRAGITAPLVVTIPEGLRIEEVAARLEEAGIVGAVDFLIATQNPGNAIGTLAGDRPAGTKIEGYLFPSTYRFSARADADRLVQAMLERFDDQFTPALRAAIAAAGETVHTVLTVASIVEREAVVARERSTIASVFWNRVVQGIPLQADPTVQYALTEDPSSIAIFGYWKTILDANDLTFESNYNTYVVSGLPPGPIAAPGLASIEATIFPAETIFLYFVARGDGTHVFAETFEEHLRNVVRFQ